MAMKLLFQASDAKYAQRKAKQLFCFLFPPRSTLSFNEKKIFKSSSSALPDLASIPPRLSITDDGVIVPTEGA